MVKMVTGNAAARDSGGDEISDVPWEADGPGTETRKANNY